MTGPDTAARAPLQVLSLFSGIGGLELGLERAGMTTVGQVEINEYCQRVLARHWPEVPRHDDVRTAPDWWRSEPRPSVDVVAGGFNCQGHSTAGRRLGTADPRWGWPWFRGVIDALAPPFVLIENVPNLVRTGLIDVLGDLADRGFDAWWGRVPAAALGAPHLRWRLFVIAAHPGRVALRQQPGWERGTDREGPAVTGFDGATWALADPHRQRRNGRTGDVAEPDRRPEPTDRGDALADPDRPGLRTRSRQTPRNTGDPAVGGSRWPAEPDVGRVAYGVSDRVDRLRALGNAVVPAVGEYIGRLLLAGSR
jgi:DNA (cytosine-5)-methyltransferase 1